MQLFLVDDNLEIAAKSLCDQHVGKQILENAQLLSWQLPELWRPYKATKAQMNHPLTIALSTSFDLCAEICDFSENLGDEHRHRFGSTHKSECVVEWCWRNVEASCVPTDQALQEAWKTDLPPVDYIRQVYIDKCIRWATEGHPMRYTKRDPPDWLLDAVSPECVVRIEK